jgi:hypothetical protein
VDLLRGGIDEIAADTAFGSRVRIRTGSSRLSNGEYANFATSPMRPPLRNEDRPQIAPIRKSRLIVKSAAGHFTPNEQGYYCGGCPYADACRAWQSHGGGHGDFLVCGRILLGETR